MFIFFLVVLIGTTMCDRDQEEDVMDSVCSFGGNAACRTYCFFTQASLTGHCDANNDCICNSTLTTNDDAVITEVEVFVINK
ncbi:unnamed protein product [Rotaria magnacalcarata]|nr:unnamed protein product [Rotaria magnacalcarata]CAF1935509.1 unnamed protein product [Rotaria magnacalcarata]